MRPGRQLDRLGQRRVPGDRPVMRPVQPDDPGQQMSIRSAGLRPRAPGAVPGAGGPLPGTAPWWMLSP
jgi:hypothetical protein